MFRYAAVRITWFLVVAGLMLVSISSGAYAYIDPGTGSFIIQMAAASILAGLFLIKGFWRNIKESLSRLFSKLRKQ